MVDELSAVDLRRDGFLQFDVDGHVECDAREQVRYQTEKQRLVLIHLYIPYTPGKLFVLTRQASARNTKCKSITDY